MSHPCLTCGACCAYFRVSFYWREIEEKTIPNEFIEDINNVYACMAGTNQKDSKCCALNGTIGNVVECSIYEKRPSPCSNFVPSYERGVKNERCDEARIKHKLKPLTLSDWDQVRNS